MYAKLENGKLILAPKKLSGEGVTVYNPPAAMYLAQGWKPVAFAAEPEAQAGSVWESGWAEGAGTIVQTWTLLPLPDDLDEAEAYDIIFGGAE